MPAVMNPCTKLSDNFFSVSTAEEAYNFIEDFETRNTVKFSCYKASKGFGDTDKSVLWHWNKVIHLFIYNVYKKINRSYIATPS